MRKNLQNKKGFTLIELLVVMTIIVVLASVGLVSYRSASIGARNSKRKSDMETVKQALVLFKQENTNYPADGYSTATSALNPDYLSDPVPADPIEPARYGYDQTDSGQGFCLCAHLEGSDKGNSGVDCTFTAATKDYYCAVEP